MKEPFSTLPLCPYPSGGVYEAIAAEGKPIAVYGMGNGAEKLLLRMAEREMTPAAFFASDGFVRGQSFRGYRVRTYSDLKAEYGEVVPVLAFASNRAEVISRFLAIDRETPLYIPDLPVAGEEDFTPAFYEQSYGDIIRAYHLLADESSRALYASLLHYKLSGRLSPLLSYTSDVSEIYKLLQNKCIECEIDVGAYRGDTVKESAVYLPKLKTVYAVEPDPKSYQKLCLLAEETAHPRVIPVHAAAGASEGSVLFHASGNRNSSSVGASYRHNDVAVPRRRIDTLTDERVDYIKYDVEGEEENALLGSHALIERDRPALLVSVYHRSRDLFFLPLFLASRYPFYRFYLRRTRCVPAWEISLIALPVS